MNIVDESIKTISKQARRDGESYISESKMPNLGDPLHKILSVHTESKPGRGTAISTLGFVFKESPHADWTYSKDGWFRKRDNPGKGYGIMFRKVQRVGAPKVMTNGITKQNIKFTYLPAEFDIEDPKNYDTGTGWFWIDGWTFRKESSLFLSNGDVDVDKIVKWVDGNAKSLVWVP